MYLRPQVLGNFRPSKEAREKKHRARLSAKKRERPGNDADHLALIAKLPCCICGRMPGGEYHHLKSGPAKAERGVGLKATDQWTLPMCHSDHIFGIELLGSQNEFDWFAERGIDAEALAIALWEATGDLPRMTEITITAWSGHEPLDIPGT